MIVIQRMCININDTFNTHSMCVNDDDMINYLFTWLHVIDSFLEADTKWFNH